VTSSPPPATGIAGAGAVAQALGRRLQAGGVPVVALAARDRQRGTRAAAFIGASVPVVSLAEISTVADRILIAVSDDGIAAVARLLATGGMRTGIVLHTSGAAGIAALAPLRATGVACGILHPLQTIATPEQGVRDLEGVAYGVAGDDGARAWATDLADRLGGWPLPIAEKGLPAYHVAAVMTSNAAAALVDAATTLMDQAGIDRATALKALGPLGRASVANVFDNGPEGALTGPIARGDIATISAHLDALASTPTSVASLYRATGRQLVELAQRRGLPAERVRQLRALLDGTTGGGK
jgi:predicted short-subunit dehydrogenase-like oxidoreductase (DUF2520 family)